MDELRAPPPASVEEAAVKRQVPGGRKRHVPTAQAEMALEVWRG